MELSIWLKEHADLEKYGNELLYKVNIRNQQGRSGIQFQRVSTGLATLLSTPLLYCPSNDITWSNLLKFVDIFSDWDAN